MAALRLVETDEKMKQWGEQDALRQTEALRRQQLAKAAGRFEFITKGNKREVIPSTCSLQEFALTKHVMQLVSRPKTATYLLENVNRLSASTDFRRLIGIIEDYPEPGKSELATLIFPVFVYFYILLLRCGPSGLLDAKSFFKANKGIFADEESYDDVLRRLCSFEKWEDVKADRYFKKFLECKYIVGLSPDVLSDLRHFIESEVKKDDDKALLYVLHFHIHFQDNDEAEYIEHASENIHTPISERNEYESMEQEDAKSVPEQMSGLFTSLSKNIENEDGKLDGVPNSDLASNRLLTSPCKSSDSDNESIRPDEGRSISELAASLKELNLNHPLISTVVTKCLEANISSVDFNEDETEIGYALGNNCIYIAPLDVKEQTKRPAAESFSGKEHKRLRFNEERMEILPSTSTSQKKGAKYQKTPRNVKTSKSSKGSKRTKEVKINKDEADKNEEPSPQVRGMKEIKVPEEENVRIVKYLPGKPHYLLAASNTKVRLLNTESCSFEAEYNTNSTFTFDIDVNSTSQYFATANMDLVSRLFSFDIGCQIKIFAGHSCPVTTVRFHPNGIYLATGSDDSTVRLFDIGSAQCIRKFCAKQFGIVIMAFSPNGKMLASGDSLSVIKVWDIKDGSVISVNSFSKVVESLGKITSLCFHSDSTLLMACNRKGESRLWDVRNPENMQMMNFKSTPLKVKFCKNGVWKMALQENPA